MVFKVGDKVNVIRKATKEELYPHIRWVQDMDKYIGKTYKVTKITGSHIELSNNNESFYFPECTLKKITRREKIERLLNGN